MSDIEGFTQSFIEVGGLRLSVHRGGEGRPVILMHGFPQNHMCWERVAPALARNFHVIIPDLRGYGDSDAPQDDADHHVYSKRAMAGDVVGLMDFMGLARAHVVGHDRGARVAYRLALDHPDRVDRLGIIEVIPTADFWAAWDAELAMKAYHWTFLAQPAPVPERMINADPLAFFEWTLGCWTQCRDLSPFSIAGLESYRRQWADPDRVHAMCADYRAGATVDRALDEADRLAGNRIAAPLCFLWASAGFPAKTGDPKALWQAWCTGEVTGQELHGTGHFAPEEAPEAILAGLRAHFLAGD